MSHLYRMLNRLCWMTALTCMASSAVSCDTDDADNSKPERAVVKLEAGEAEEHSVSFRIIPSDAEEVRYAVVMDGQAEPTVDQIFEGGGISADATVAKSYTAGDLEPNTSYNIIAAARNAAGCSEPAKITMKTAEPGVPASVSLEPGEATIQSITFRLSPLNATKAAYVCLAEGETLPSAESILAEGDPAAAAVAGDYTVENLEPNTTYRIAAAAEGRTGLSAVVHIDMTTAIPAPTVSLEAGEAAVDALAFTLTSADAGKVAYICVRSGGTVPAAADILSSGVEAEAGKAVSCRIPDLEPDTEYTIVAAASDLAGGNPMISEPLTMKTLKPVLAEPRVGDFYYSDGTWSTELDASKTPIGIVFYTGAASDFRDSANLYKQKDGTTPMSEIRGYVVALQDATLVDGKNIEVWWSFFDGSYEGSCSSQLDDFLGYSNTKLIETAASNRCGGLAASNDNFPAAYYATVAYEEVCPAPEASSGWFLPSAYQFKYIYDKVYFNENGTMSVWLEKSFETLGDKATPLYERDAEFWTSTEKYDSSGYSCWAYYFCFDSSSFRPGFIADYRKNAEMRVRSMLVF